MLTVAGIFQFLFLSLVAFLSPLEGLWFEVPPWLLGTFYIFASCVLAVEIQIHATAKKHLNVCSPNVNQAAAPWWELVSSGFPTPKSHILWPWTTPVRRLQPMTRFNWRQMSFVWVCPFLCGYLWVGQKMGNQGKLKPLLRVPYSETHTVDGRTPFRTTFQKPWNDSIPP